MLRYTSPVYLLSLAQSDQRTAGPSSSATRRHLPQQEFRRRSLSPERSRHQRRPSSADRPAGSGRKPDFQSSTSGRALSACAVCLGRHPHKIVDCTSSRLWDNSQPALAIRSNKVLSMRDGKPICGEWQRAAGCHNTSHDFRHICSGCTSSSHGAQECPRAQKIASANSL